MQMAGSARLSSVAVVCRLSVIGRRSSVPVEEGIGGHPRASEGTRGHSGSSDWLAECTYACVRILSARWLCSVLGGRPCQAVPRSGGVPRWRIWDRGKGERVWERGANEWAGAVFAAARRTAGRRIARRGTNSCVTISCMRIAWAVVCSCSSECWVRNAPQWKRGASGSGGVASAICPRRCLRRTDEQRTGQQCLGRGCGKGDGRGQSRGREGGRAGERAGESDHPPILLCRIASLRSDVRTAAAGVAG